MDKFWERYIQSRPAPGASKGAFDAFAAAHRDPGPRNMAHGGRIGFAKAKLVKLDKANLKRLTDSTNELYNTYGKDVVDKASKEKHGVTFDKLQGADKRSNFKRKFKKEFEKSGTFMTEGESRKFFRQKRVLREQDIQIKLLEETNKNTFFDPKKFAKANKLTMEELKDQAALLQKNIYKKRMLIAGTTGDKRAVLDWVPKEDFKLDNALSKMSKSGLTVFKDNRTDAMFYDAFGRKFKKGSKTELNPSYDLEKYKAIRKNKNEYDALRRIINKKYPSIDFQLDHPLSKSTLNKIFNASAEELTRVNVLDAELNNNFKKVLSQKYQDALGYNAKGEKVGKVNLEAKKAVEKVARDLKLNIGKVSKDLTGFDYGVKEFQKLNIRDEIIKSLKNQKDLSLNFKKYIKNNPDLFKLAGFDDPSKIRTTVTKVTDKQIQGIEKIFKERGMKLRKGQAGFIATDILKDMKKFGSKGLRLLSSEWVWPEIVIGWLDKQNMISKGMSEERASSEMWKNMTLGLRDKGVTEKEILG